MPRDSAHKNTSIKKSNTIVFAASLTLAGLACALTQGCQGQKFSGTKESAPVPAPTSSAPVEGEKPDPKVEPAGVDSPAPSDGSNAMVDAIPGTDGMVEGKPADGMPATGKPAVGMPATGKPAVGMPATGKPVVGKILDPKPGVAIPLMKGAAGVTFEAGIDSDTIKKCLNLWGNHPFKSVTKANFKRMQPNLAIPGFQLNPMNDTEVTAADRIILIPLSVKLASNVNMRLMNPKGWYCIKVDIAAGVEDIHTHTTVTRACTAKLAKSSLSIGANSQTGGVTIGEQSVGQLGIAIDATITEEPCVK